MIKPIRVSASVTTDRPEVVQRAVEALTRAATGLALEGVSVFVMIDPDIDDEEG